MKILILGAGRMGSWLAKELSQSHELSVYDRDRAKLAALSHGKRLNDPSEVEGLDPDLVVNAVTMAGIQDAFRAVLPYLRAGCLLSDIASVKTGLPQLYQELGRRFVSTHPMFGPTFADTGDLRDENAIIIKESDEGGKDFFRDFYARLGIRVFEYGFEELFPFEPLRVFPGLCRGHEAPGSPRDHLPKAPVRGQGTPFGG